MKKLLLFFLLILMELKGDVTLNHLKFYLKFRTRIFLIFMIFIIKNCLKNNNT